MAQKRWSQGCVLIHVMCGHAEGGTEGCVKLHLIARNSAECALAVVDVDGVAVVVNSVKGREKGRIHTHLLLIGHVPPP